MKLLLKIIAALSGGLSLFRLGAQFWKFDFSTIVQQIMDTYQKILVPITTALGPIFGWITGLFDLQLPEWWPHAFVIWVVIGGIGGRAWASEEGFGDPEAEESFIGTLRGLALGPVAFLWGCLIAVINMFNQDFDYSWYIFRETLYVVLVTATFFATNAFT